MIDRAANLTRRFFLMLMIVGWIILAVLSIRHGQIFIHAIGSGHREPGRDFLSRRERVLHGAPYVAMILLYGAYIAYQVVAAKRDRRAGVTDPCRLLPPRVDEQHPVRSLLLKSLPFLLLAWLVYPYTGDVRIYLHYGAMADAGINPLVHANIAFTSAWSKTLAWKITSPYGPGAIGLFMIPGYFGASHAAITTIQQTLVPIYLWKTMALAAHVGSALLIVPVLSDRSDRWDWALLYLVNPYSLFELVSNAHLDVFVILLLLLALWAVRNDRWVAAAIAIILAATIKSYAVIFLMLLAVAMLSSGRYRAFLTTAVLLGVVTWLLTAKLLPHYAAWRSLLNSSVEQRFSGNGASVMYDTISRWFHWPMRRRLEAATYIFKVMKAMYVLCSAGIAWRLWKRGKQEFHNALLMGMLLLFLLACFWFRPWYLVILVVPPLFLAASFWVRTAVVTMLLGTTISYAIFGPGPEFGIATCVAPMICLLIAIAHPDRDSESKPPPANDYPSKQGIVRSIQ